MAPASDALFAAVFYALNPYHLLIVYWRSAYAELLAAALLPLLLLCLLRSTDSERLAPDAVVESHLAAAWLDERTRGRDDPLLNGRARAVLLAVRQLSSSERSVESAGLASPAPRRRWQSLLGAGLASFYLLPAIYEQRWINLSQVLSPGVRPQDNFLFTILADPDHNRFNLLVST